MNTYSKFRKPKKHTVPSVYVNFDSEFIFLAPTTPADATKTTLTKHECWIFTRAQRFKTHRCNKHHLDEKSLQNSLSSLSSEGNRLCFSALANTEQIQAMLELLRCNRLGQHFSRIFWRMHLFQQDFSRSCQLPYLVKPYTNMLRPPMIHLIFSQT